MCEEISNEYVFLDLEEVQTYHFSCGGDDVGDLPVDNHGDI